MPEFRHMYVKEAQTWIYLTVNKLNGKCMLEEIQGEIRTILVLACC
jgi:hypothetical protein